MTKEDVDWYVKASRRILTHGRVAYSSTLAVVIATIDHAMAVSEECRNTRPERRKPPTTLRLVGE